MPFSLPVPLTLIVLFALGVHRLTRLITRDKIPLIGVPRELFTCRWATYETDSGLPETGEARKIGISGKKTNLFMSSLAYLWGCDWCMSIWIAGGVGYLTWRFTDVMFWVLAGLAASTVTGMLVKWEKILDKRGE